MVSLHSRTSGARYCPSGLNADGVPAFADLGYRVGARLRPTRRAASLCPVGAGFHACPRTWSMDPIDRMDAMDVAAVGARGCVPAIRLPGVCRCHHEPEKCGNTISISHANPS